MLNRGEMQLPPEAAARVERVFEQVFRALKPRTALSAVKVRFRPYANGNCQVQIQDGALGVRLSDIYVGAPDEIIEALAWMVLSKLCRKPVPPEHPNRFRSWMGRKEMRRTMHLVRQLRGRKTISPPQGECYNLEQIFEDLNFRFFHGLMARPNLGWSRTASRTLLGHWDPSHNAIILSRFLDRPEVPREVVELILYHEMLHLRHPAEHHNGRRRIHTRSFREAERQFPHYKEWSAALKKLLHS